MCEGLQGIGFDTSSGIVILLPSLCLGLPVNLQLAGIVHYANQVEDVEETHPRMTTRKRLYHGSVVRDHAVRLIDDTTRMGDEGLPFIRITRQRG